MVVLMKDWGLNVDPRMLLIYIHITNIQLSGGGCWVPLLEVSLGKDWKIFFAGWYPQHSCNRTMYSIHSLVSSIHPTRLSIHIAWLAFIGLGQPRFGLASSLGVDNLAWRLAACQDKESLKSVGSIVGYLLVPPRGTPVRHEYGFEAFFFFFFEVYTPGQPKAGLGPSLSSFQEFIIILVGVLDLPSICAYGVIHWRFHVLVSPGSSLIQYSYLPPNPADAAAARLLPVQVLQRLLQGQSGSSEPHFADAVGRQPPPYLASLVLKKMENRRLGASRN